MKLKTKLILYLNSYTSTLVTDIWNTYTRRARSKTFFLIKMFFIYLKPFYRPYFFVRHCLYNKHSSCLHKTTLSKYFWAFVLSEFGNSQKHLKNAEEHSTVTTTKLICRICNKTYPVEIVHQIVMILTLDYLQNCARY